jgi:hypothetical protein
MIASDDVTRCSDGEWKELRKLTSNGMLFEVIDWINQGKPTLRPL